MTALIANVVQSTDSFGQWLAKTNQIITVISNTAVTTNSNTAVGNAAITGKFSAGSVSLANTGFLRISSGSSNSIINASSILIQSSSTTNTVITDTGVYLSGTAFYTDVVMSMGNSVIRSSNITSDSLVLKNTLRLGNTYLSTMNANTNNLFAIDTIRAGDVEANVYIDRNGLEIRRNPTAASGFANARMTNDTLWIKNINANTLTVRSINYTAAASIEFPGNTHFLGQNNYFRYGLTANAPLIVTSTGPGTGILVESTDSGDSTGPDIVFRRSSSSPAAGDDLAGIYWQGRNAAATNLNYASLISEIASPTAGAEGTNVFLTQKVAGTDTRTLYINSSGYVGIGQTSPSAPLHITSNTAGTGILVESTNSDDSTGPDIVFRRTSASPLAGDNLAGIYWQGRNDAATNLNYAQLISEIASPTAGAEGTNVFLVQKIAGTDTRTLHINSAGNVGLGTAAPTQKLHVVGGALITGTTTINGAITVGTTATITGALTAGGNITAFSSSDERLKENVANISNPLEKLALLNGVTFDWKDSYIESQGGLDGMFVRKNDVGIIAQDLEKVLPQLVAERDDGYKAIKYDRIVALLIEAVKELKAEVDSLKNGN
jgi:hypothetical protein